MHSSPEFRSLKAKIRVLCKQRRIRLEEFMKTFDVHRVKKIKVEQFKRALDVSGLHLAPAEVALILAKYRLPDDPSFVNYRRFCDLIDKACTVKGLETKPELHASIGSDSAAVVPAKSYGTAALSPAEAERLRAVQSKLLAAVMTKGIVLKDVFHDFDRSNAGKVTKPQFVRDVLDLLYLAPDELDVLVKAYGDDLDVHYRALHFDICPGAAGAGTKAAAPRSPDRRHFSAPAAVSASSPYDAPAVQELEAELSELVYRDRIRTKNFFTDFDALRTGKCTPAQFQRCVKLCFSALTEADLALLVRKYSVESLDGHRVDYVRFCNYIEGKRSSRDASGDNNNSSSSSSSSSRNTYDSVDDALATIVASTLGVTGTGTSGPSKCSREVRGVLSESEADVLRAVLTRLGSFCATRRVLLKPVFQDFDKGRHEYVTRDQFVRVLTLCKLPLVSDDETRVVLKRYASASGDRFVNYVTFCFDLEHWRDTSDARPASRSSGSRASEILSPSRVRPTRVTASDSALDDQDAAATAAFELHTRSVPMLLRYVKQIVKRDRIRLEEYYRDFDKLRHGKVTVAQFAAGLSASGFVLTRDEMALLSDEYASRDVVDSAGQSFVAWKRFVDDVESVFTVKGLERAPAHDVESLGAMRTEQFGGVKHERALSSADERLVTQTVVTIKRAIDRERLSIKPAFEDFDRAKQGFISSTKFERVLSMFRLLPADATHTRAVVLKFREQIANGTASATLSSVCDVNYRAFLQALDIVGATQEAARATLVLPGSVAYRQELLNSGPNGTVDPSTKRLVRDHRAAFTDVQALVAEIRRQLSARRIRIKEFVTEGDKLRSGEITVAKFHTALNRSGCVLDASDVKTLSAHFLSTKNADKIDWRAFLEALDSVGSDHSASVPDVPSPRTGSDATRTSSALDTSTGDATVARALERLRREVNHRRLHMKPYFQDYDHTKSSRVTKFQFAAVLDMMRVPLSASDVQALSQHFAVRDGRRVTTDVNYVAFILAVDADYQ